MACAHLVEQGFQMMGGLADARKAKTAGAALDGVGRAKNGVQGFFRGLPGFKVEQAGFHHRQAFEAFLEKPGVELPDVDAHCGNTRFSVASNCSGLKGFTSQPVAPAARPSCFLPSPASVVSISIGVYW